MSGSPLADLLRGAVGEHDGPLALGFSGGADSALLARTFRDHAPRLLLLLASKPGRDLALADAAAASLGLSYEVCRVDEESMLEAVFRHREILRRLDGYTQRILGVCEALLCEEASRRGETLVTGHGPEAVLGGFRRHAAPDPSDGDAISERLRLNRMRLEKVAAMTGCRIVLPYYSREVVALFIRWRRSGLDKEALYDLMPEVARPALKSSLQNGSGIHYLFSRVAKRNGHRFVRSYMEDLLA